MAATLGAHLVRILEAYGVEVVFGIPGVHTLELYRGLEGSSIRHVTPRHEQGAGFMADGYARVSGKPGVCFVITGPGVTNIATAVAQAYGDSIPMLVISSVNPVGAMGSGRGFLHELPDQQGLMSRCTAFSQTIFRVEELAPAVARAFALFNSSRPRPVHIEIPIDILGADIGHLDLPRAVRVPIRPAPTESAIREAVAVCDRSRRPVIVVGGGAGDASAEIRRLAEALDAPVVMTSNGRGLMPPEHPLAVPFAPSRRTVAAMLADADLVIAAGTEFGPTDYEDEATGLSPSVRGTLVRIDIDAGQALRGQTPDLAIVADASLALDALAAGVAAADRGGRERARAVRDLSFADLNSLSSAGVRLLETVRDALDGVIIVGDSTKPVYAGSVAFAARKPRSWFHSATGYGTLGYGLPAAIGAKIAAPSHQVVAVVGDGGFQFTLAELGSAREINAGVIVLLWNNRGYGEIKTYMQERGIATLGVDLYTPDFQMLARAYGWDAVRVTDFANLAALLKQAAERAGPTLIEFDETAYLAFCRDGHRS